MSLQDNYLDSQIQLPVLLPISIEKYLVAREARLEGQLDLDIHIIITWCPPYWSLILHSNKLTNFRHRILGLSNRRGELCMLPSPSTSQPEPMRLYISLFKRERESLSQLESLQTAGPEDLVGLDRMTHWCSTIGGKLNCKSRSHLHRTGQTIKE